MVMNGYTGGLQREQSQRRNKQIKRSDIVGRKELQRRRTLVLPVERAVTTTPAERVGFGVSLTARLRYTRMRDIRHV
jgi:hypothetical protein